MGFICFWLDPPCEILFTGGSRKDLHQRGGGMEIQGKGWLRALALGVVILAVGVAASAAAQDTVPDELLVKFRGHVPVAHAEGVVHALGAIVLERLNGLSVHRLRVPAAALETVERALSQHPDVEFVERNRRLPHALVPNDASYPSQYHLPAISAPQAWDITRGASTIVIAILDTGVDPGHPDLASKLVPGFNFYNGNTDTADVFGHGTAVAGTAAAIGNNDIGVASVAWQVGIMPIRVSDANGYAYSSTLANGLTYAADHGARVMNMSFAGVAASNTITNAANYARSRGAVVVAAAGNCGCFDSTPPNAAMISVAATDAGDNLASFSSQGNHVDVAAPGVAIFTTARGGGYGSVSGTSFSSPIVAGVVALMMSVNPALAPSDLESMLKSTADDRGAPGYDTGFGYGRVNAFRAVAAARDTIAPPPPAPTVTLAYQGKLRDRVGQGNTALGPDGALDGTLAVSLAPGSGTRTVTDLTLRSGAGGVWDTTSGSASWILGAASGVDNPLLNGASGAVSFAIPDGGGFSIFGADTAATQFGSGAAFTLTVGFADGSTATATTTVGTPAPPPPPTLTLAYQGKVRDRVGQGNTAVAPDGLLDGTFTVSLAAGSGPRTVTALELRSSTGGIWDTTSGSAYWVLGAAAGLDSALLNGSSGAVSFAVGSGGSFAIFGADLATTLFPPGATFTLTATFADGTTATATRTIGNAPTPGGTLSYRGKARDRVGRGNTALAPDGLLDGTFTMSLAPGSGPRTVTALELRTGTTGIWDTTPGSAFWVLGAAGGLDGPLLNDGSGAVSFAVADGGSFTVFGADPATTLFFPGATFTLTATFADGGSASATATIGNPTAPGVTLSYQGKPRDRVGRGNIALAPDGLLDGAFTVSFAPGSGNRTVTALELRTGTTGIWDTTSGSASWILGAAPGLDSPLLNDGSGAVNFAVTDGGGFTVFGADPAASLFTPGATFTLTLTFADGSAATATATLGP
jgi:hypothetical protein